MPHSRITKSRGEALDKLVEKCRENVQVQGSGSFYREHYAADVPNLCDAVEELRHKLQVAEKAERAAKAELKALRDEYDFEE